MSYGWKGSLTEADFYKVSWLQDILNRGKQSRHDSPREPGKKSQAIDILVTRGPDLGQRFSLDGEEIMIGRGRPRPGQPGDVLLSDRHISRAQAMIRRINGKWFIEHLAGSKSPTKVNGRSISTCELNLRDQIEIGQDLLVIQATNREGLSTLSLQEEDEDAFDSEKTLPNEMEELGTIVADITPAAQRALLHVLEGHGYCVDSPFALKRGMTSIGRSPSCDFTIREPSISRMHLELSWNGDLVTLKHISKTNPTIINQDVHEGVGSLRVLNNGDEIAICERVRLRLEIEGAATPESSSRPKHPTESTTSLTKNMRRLINEEERLEKLRREVDERYRHTGSFLDIDVVDSTGLKGGESKTAYIIVSFDAFRTFVGDIVCEFNGQVLNSNGDELMCFFPVPVDAVYCAEAIQARLVVFNQSQNKLKGDFRTRIGVHSGTSLVDLSRGKAYSNILDEAGHLQKASEPGSFLISAETLAELPADLPFEKGPCLTKGGKETFRPIGSLPARSTATVKNASEKSSS